MSVYSGPEIPNDGLVFAYDMTNTEKSWKGAPTVNLITNPTNEVIATVNEFAVFQDLSPIFDAQGPGTYSISADIKTTKPGPITVYTASGSVEYNIGYYTANCQTYYQRFYFNNISVTQTDPAVSVSNLSFYGTYGSGVFPSIKNVQVEKNSFCTPFVVGTRSTTQTILDQTNNSTITTNSSISYLNNNTFEFLPNNNNSTLTVPLSTSLNKLTGTISAWVYPKGYSGSNGIFVNRDDSTSNALDWLWIGSWSTGGTFYFRLGNGTDCCSQDLTVSSWSSVCPVNTWSNVCVTWQSGSFSRIYMNGKLIASRTITSIPNTNPSVTGRIGLGHVDGSSGSWNGAISNFSIFNRALSDTEVSQNFNAHRGRFNI